MRTIQRCDHDIFGYPKKKLSDPKIVIMWVEENSDFVLFPGSECKGGLSGGKTPFTLGI